MFLIAKALAAFLVIVFAFILMIRSEKFQPELAHTKAGWWVAWASRLGLMTVIVVSFSHLLDIYIDTGYHDTRDLALLTGIALQFARPVHKLFKKQEAMLPLVYVSKPKPIIFGYGLSYLAVIIATVSFFWLGPIVEQKYFPVLTDIAYSNATRSDDKVCWNMHYYKARDTYPEYILYLVRRHDGKTFDTTVVRDSNSTAPNVVPRNYGQTYDVRLCAALPSYLKDEKDLAVVGEAKYHTHNLWPFFLKIGPINIPDK